MYGQIMATDYLCIYIFVLFIILFKLSCFSWDSFTDGWGGGVLTHLVPKSHFSLLIFTDF